MSLNIDAERWCEAIVALSPASRPGLCNAPAYDFCAECGRSICQDHSVYCGQCDSAVCMSCQHECAISSAKPPQTASVTSLRSQEIAVRLLRWMRSVARPATLRKFCPYCQQVMSSIGADAWVCRSCFHVERHPHVSFLEDATSGQARSCHCARCRSRGRAAAA